MWFKPMYHRKNAESETLPENLKILKRRVRQLNKIKTPRVGDFIIMNDGSVRRFAHNWDNGLQPSASFGSFYLGNGYISYSGALDPTIPNEDIIETRKKRAGLVWFFSRNRQGADRGIHYKIKFRVYKQRTES